MFLLASNLRNISCRNSFNLLTKIPSCSKCCTKQVNWPRLNVLKRNIKYYLPDDAQNNKLLGYWFLTCSGMVFGAVVLGGVTRLTESGLSMVSWKMFGEKMPSTDEEWLQEFENYQQYPEFKMKNKEISLEDFKWIWRMEYYHRMWGRCIGLVYAIPCSIFWFQRRFSEKYRTRCLIMGGLILAQGLMGWYMVKSGLEDRFDGPNDVPRVSQYRLAAHLSLAFILYASLLRGALDHLSPALNWPVMNKSITKFKILSHSSKGLVYLTAISGAFVAGLDAGLVYNSFPKMGDKWLPDDIFDLKPKLKNFTENPTTVQFDHRILGTTTLSFITAVWLWSFKFKLPPGAKFAANAFGIMAYTQVAIGITTLLKYVPVYLGALHQSGSLVLLSLATWLTHELKYVKKVAK
ncbi:hypothetical protein V9T40_010943 [Parthenolecanium corni]|uniref:Cytochrome c oxidase assembly protein COX15 homolog n=1 Tax=Parthenolecanium corni TaxID=536013 RepID=A0AAN9T4I3_9HEMI